MPRCVSPNDPTLNSTLAGRQAAGVGAQELHRARYPALVVDAAAENDRVIDADVVHVVSRPDFDGRSHLTKPGRDPLGHALGGPVLTRVGDENVGTSATP
jgi:hypothetical protein